MKKLIYDVIVQEAKEILKETWNEYENPKWLNPVSFDDVLKALEDVVEATRLRDEIKLSTKT